jgi:two-component system response regulator RstA
VLLDIMLPGQDGLSLCRDLRPRFAGPIVMLTSLDSDMNQILSLELGANDYILKTTPPRCCWPGCESSFASRGRASRPWSAAPPQRLQFGRLQIDGPGRDVRLDGESIPLSTADFDLLWELACHAGQILGREALFRSLRGATTTARIAAWTWPSPVCAASWGTTPTTRPHQDGGRRRLPAGAPGLGISPAE